MTEKLMAHPAAIHAVAAGEPMLAPTITRRLIAAATSTAATALLDSAA